MTKHNSGNLKQSNKKHKGKNGKRAQSRLSGPGKTAGGPRSAPKANGNKAIESRQSRLNRTKQIKQQKREQAWLKKRQGGLGVRRVNGSNFVSNAEIRRVIGVIPLSDLADVQRVIDVCADEALHASVGEAEGLSKTEKENRHWLRGSETVQYVYDSAQEAELMFLTPPLTLHRDIFVALDIARAADILVLVLCLDEANNLGTLIDDVGHQTVAALKAAGCPDVVFCVEGLGNFSDDDGTVCSGGSFVSMRTTATSSGRGKRVRLRKAVQQHLAAQALFPGSRLAPLSRRTESVLDSAGSLQNQPQVPSLLRTLCSFTPRTVNWRGCRSYLLADAGSIQIQPDHDVPGLKPALEAASSLQGQQGLQQQQQQADVGQCTYRVRMAGYLRGQRPLHLHSLVHLCGVGAARLSRTWPVPAPFTQSIRDGTRDLVSGVVQAPLPLHGPALQLSSDRLTEAEAAALGAGGAVLVADPSRQDGLRLEAQADLLLGEQTWPTEAEMQSGAELGTEDRTAGRDRRALLQGQQLPQGMSAYQADWFMDEEGQVDFTAAEGGADSNSGDEGGGDEEGDEDFSDGDLTLATATAAAATTRLGWSGGAGAVGAGPGEEQHRSRWRDEARADAEFPDEMDTPQDVSARHRFARYRALQSFRASPWHPKENLPQDYARIFQFENFAGAQKRVLAESQMAEQLQRVAVLEAERARKGKGKDKGKGKGKGTALNMGGKMELDPDVSDEGEGGGEEEDEDMDMTGDGASSSALPSSATSHITVAGTDDEYLQSGVYLCLELEGVPQAVVERLRTHGFLMAFGLFAHEQKLSVLHCSLQKTSAGCWTEPIKSKEELLFQVGFRSFLTKPIFSESNLNCDKHKFERFLQNDGSFCMGSCYGPICVSASPLPVLVFKQLLGAGNGWALVATGTVSSVDPDRIMLKKVVLTGHPIRVRKKVAVVKHLFYDPQDVRWFKPAELTTKFGLRGHIKEAVGTHGLLKAHFSDVIKQNDTVMLSLYKRVYPKFPKEGLCLT